MSRIAKIILGALAMMAVVGCGEAAPEPTPIPTPEPTATPTPSPTLTPTPLPTATPTPLPTATPTLHPTPTPLVPTPTPASDARDVEEDSEAEESGPDAEQVLANSAEAMSEAKSFAFNVTGHLLVDSTDSEVRIPITYSGVSAAPDRSEASLVLNVFFFSLRIDLIIIGDNVWTTNPQTEVWEQAPPGSIALPNPALLMGGDTPALSDPVIVGPEMVDGVETLRLTGIPQIEALSGLGDEIASTDVWIGAEDWLVYRIDAGGEIDLDALGLPLASAGITGMADLVLEIRLSDYGTLVEIRPPEIN